ncbi:MAG: EamA family transporter [Bacilli bacterium]|nr:EamA family transporter [Bacilli bacterium]
MKGKLAAVSWSIIHSIGDTIEENILLKYNENQYLFWMTLVTGILTMIVALIGGIELSIISIFVTIIYSFAIIGGDICYIKAIQTLPIGLANLIDAGSIFIILICDIFLGYIKPNLIFLILFILFFISIYVFSYETNKMKGEITNKKIDLQNIFLLITSTIFYASEPYFIKIASSKGGNEYGINLIYYLVAIPFFYYLYQKDKKNIKPLKVSEKKHFQKLIFLVGIIYTITSLLYMLAYIGETPLIVTLLTKLQLFGVVIISVIRKTDKMNFKKVLSLIVGVLCIIGMTLLT